MRFSNSKAFIPLQTATRLMAGNPLPSLIIVIITCILGALGTFLEMRVALPPNPLFSALLQGVATLPLDLYVIPRFLLFLDAQSMNTAKNPYAQWKETFEARWMKAIGSKLLWYITMAAGFALFIFPGVLAFTLLCWMPYWVLLRGETISEAAKRSARLASRRWPLMLAGMSIPIIIYLCAFWAIAAVIQHYIPQPTPWILLTSPLFWVVRFTGGLLGLWLSACALALFQMLETIEATPPVKPDITE